MSKASHSLINSGYINSAPYPACMPRHLPALSHKFVMHFLLLLQLTGKLGLRPDLWTVPVKHINGNREHERQTSQQRACVREMPLPAEIVIQWVSVERSDASKEVTCEAVATSSRGSIDAVAQNHVVDCCAVDREIGDANEAREYHRCDPRRVLRTQTRPCEAEQADEEKRRCPEEIEQAAFWFDFLRLRLPLLENSLDEWEPYEVGNDIPETDGNESEAGLRGAEVPLPVDRAVALEEGEDKSVAETAE